MPLVELVNWLMIFFSLQWFTNLANRLPVRCLSNLASSNIQSSLHLLENLLPLIPSHSISRYVQSALGSFCSPFLFRALLSNAPIRSSVPSSLPSSSISHSIQKVILLLLSLPLDRALHPSDSPLWLFHLQSPLIFPNRSRTIIQIKIWYHRILDVKKVKNFIQKIFLFLFFKNFI